MDIKICSICNKNSDETIINKYTSKKDNKIYWNSTCKKCKSLQDKYKYENEIFRNNKIEQTTIYRNTELGFKSQMLHDAKKNKKFIFSNISLDIINKLQSNQLNKCALTGIKLIWQTRNPHQASIDRIDSSKGYIEDNIHLVILPINLMKLDYNIGDFKNILQIIKYENQEHIEHIENIDIYNMYNTNKIFRKKIQTMFNKINSRTYNVYININDILNKLQECNMICCLSNVKMTYQKNNWNVISVDRIDSSKNYSIDNIQIICWILNCAKREYKNDDIKQIVNHIKQF
jgi:hypothetical protein